MKTIEDKSDDCRDKESDIFTEERLVAVNTTQCQGVVKDLLDLVDTLKEIKPHFRNRPNTMVQLENLDVNLKSKLNELST